MSVYMRNSQTCYIMITLVSVVWYGIKPYILCGIVCFCLFRSAVSGFISRKDIVDGPGRSYSELWWNVRQQDVLLVS